MKIHHLLFDLDNTLYPSSSAIDAGISRRMMEFVAMFLNLPVEKAAAIRKERMPLYGTTLEWLRTEHNLTDVQEFFSYVHPSTEAQELTPDKKLRPFLMSLGMPMTILTNAPRVHADTVLEFFDIKDLFESIHDIETNNLKGKPHKSAYMNAITYKGHSLDDTLFFDDHAKYTKGYTSIGGKSVLVCGQDADIDGKNVCCKTTDGWDKSDPNAFACIKTIYDIPQLLEKI